MQNQTLNILYFCPLAWFMEILRKQVKENDECNPIGIYGALKFSAEKQRLTDKHLIFHIPLLDLQLYMVKDA